MLMGTHYLAFYIFICMLESIKIKQTEVLKKNEIYDYDLVTFYDTIYNYIIYFTIILINFYF